MSNAAALLLERLPPAIQSLLDHVEVESCLPSTHDRVWQLLAEPDCQWAVCLADAQTAGRGRRGKIWHSPALGNLYLSLGFPLPNSQLAQSLSVVMGLVVARVLHRLGVSDIQLKWPNDLWVHQAKLAGILVESRFGLKSAAVVGLGLNFRLPADHQQHIDQVTTALDQHLDPLPNREALAAMLITEMIQQLHQLAVRPIDSCLADWPEYDALYQRRITVLAEDTQYDGIAQGITLNGELRVQCGAEVRHLSNSHLSIRLAS